MKETNGSYPWQPRWAELADRIADTAGWMDRLMAQSQHDGDFAAWLQLRNSLLLLYNGGQRAAFDGIVKLSIEPPTETNWLFAG